MEKKRCEKCHKQMATTNFFTYRDGSKTELCKACMTMHIDNFDPETYVWILEKMDVPYVPAEWDSIRDKAYVKHSGKLTGASVLGKYLSKMKLRQWRDYTWADSEKLQVQLEEAAQVEAERQRAQQQIVKKQFENGEISEAQYRTLVTTNFQKEHEYIISQPDADPIGENNLFNEKDFLPEEELPDLTADLTLEDKQYLAMKWGRTYKVSEWVELETKYTEMMESFDIQDADSKNTLIFICKTYLKMNQAIDCGDVEGYQKLSRVYDTLRKSMKVTAAQNKEEKTDFIDSVGQLVAYCQKNGGKIPRYEINTPYDIVDKIINDLKEYNKTLIYEDTALARQIEDYLKEVRAAAEQKKDREQAKAKGLDTPQVTDQDFIDFKNFVHEEKDKNHLIESEDIQDDTSIVNESFY